jgi:hypothetical protein
MGSGMNRRLMQVAIVLFVFPIFVLAFHKLSIVPMLLLFPLLSYLELPMRTTGIVFSGVFLLVAIWCAVLVCRLIWPKPDEAGIEHELKKSDST